MKAYQKVMLLLYPKLERMAEDILSEELLEGRIKKGDSVLFSSDGENLTCRLENPAG